jgi:hypothetical protein
MQVTNASFRITMLFHSPAPISRREGNYGTQSVILGFEGMPMPKIQVVLSSLMINLGHLTIGPQALIRCAIETLISKPITSPASQTKLQVPHLPGSSPLPWQAAVTMSLPNKCFQFTKKATKLKSSELAELPIVDLKNPPTTGTHTPKSQYGPMGHSPSN